MPGTAGAFGVLLRQAYEVGAPAYIRTSVRQNSGSRDVRFGKLHPERAGGDGPTVGPMLERTLAATPSRNRGTIGPRQNVDWYSWKDDL